MKKTIFRTTVLSLMLCGTFTGLTSTLAPPDARANEYEFRAGAMIQVPFSLNSRFPAFDPSRIRIGLTTQYANIEKTDLITTRYYVNDTFDHAENALNKGNQVFGLEGNIFIEPWNSLNLSAELLGFYGNNDIQGAVGGGYSIADHFFLDGKVMFPYSEIGLRMMRNLEVYGGAKTFGSFNPSTDRSFFDRRLYTAP